MKIIGSHGLFLMAAAGLLAQGASQMQTDVLRTSAGDLRINPRFHVS